MIARLANIERAYAEIREQKFNCIRIRPTDGKGVFGSRVNIDPEAVVAYLMDIHRDFQGEYIVELWEHGKGQKDDQTRYVVSSGGSGNAQMNGSAMMGMQPMIMQLMQQSHAKDIEILKMQLEAKYGGDDNNYLKEGIGMMKELLLQKKHGVQEPAQRIAPQPGHVAGDGADGGEEEAGDVLDDYLEIEPDAEEILDRLIKLKREKPGTYAEALAALKQM